jgi:hypothetical protein
VGNRDEVEALVSCRRAWITGEQDVLQRSARRPAGSADDDGLSASRLGGHRHTDARMTPARTRTALTADGQRR